MSITASDTIPLPIGQRVIANDNWIGTIRAVLQAGLLPPPSSYGPHYVVQETSTGRTEVCPHSKVYPFLAHLHDTVSPPINLKTFLMVLENDLANMVQGARNSHIDQLPRNSESTRQLVIQAVFARDSAYCRAQAIDKWLQTHFSRVEALELKDIPFDGDKWVARIGKDF